MHTALRCRVCGSTDFDVHRYESMLVLSYRTALFSLRCPVCGNLVTSVCLIPEDMEDFVQNQARELGAGMGGQLR